jgi:hypothetical protein
VRVHLLDVEWLLSTLFDASLLKLRAAGNGGSFLTLAGCVSALRGQGVSRTDAGRARLATMSRTCGSEVLDRRLRPGNVFIRPQGRNSKKLGVA